MTEQLLTAGAGALLSAGLAFIPGVSERWATLTGRGKRLALAILILIVAVASMAAGCADMFADIAAECSRGGIEVLVTRTVSAFIGTQTMYVYAAQDKQDRPPEGQPATVQ